MKIYIFFFLLCVIKKKKIKAIFAFKYTKLIKNKKFYMYNKCLTFCPSIIYYINNFIQIQKNVMFNL